MDDNYQPAEQEVTDLQRWIAAKAIFTLNREEAADWLCRFPNLRGIGSASAADTDSDEYGYEDATEWTERSTPTSGWRSVPMERRARWGGSLFNLLRRWL